MRGVRRVVRGVPGELGGALGGVSRQMKGVVARLGGVLCHAVTRPTALVLLRQQAVSHQVLQHASDVLGVLPGDLLHSAIGHAAFHLGRHYRLHRRFVQFGKPVAKAQTQRLIHFVRNQAGHRQHQFHAVRLQRFFQEPSVLQSCDSKCLIYMGFLRASGFGCDKHAGCRHATARRFEFGVDALDAGLQSGETVKLGQRVANRVGWHHACASNACNSFSVRPFASFHSIRPLALRPNTTAAAVLGELNGKSWAN